MRNEEREDAHSIAARFRLHLRCEHCLLESRMVLEVPAVEDAPTDIDELLESAFLGRQSFMCAGCDTSIGIIAGVAQLRLPERADA